MEGRKKQEEEARHISLGRGGKVRRIDVYTIGGKDPLYKIF